MTVPSRFTGIDTVIIRVCDVVAASLWYTQRLGAEIVYDDAEQRLAVLEFANGSTLTLWQVDDGAAVARSSTYPILATSDARATHAALKAQEVAVEALHETPGVIYFRFTDPDGNPLEACEVKA
jgi:catechol 2,3-dioxygenase-like lactoylglutathione lyase family enzyme